MNFKDLKNKIKEQQKQLAQKISRGKHLRKPKNRTSPTKEDLFNYYWRYDGESYYSGYEGFCEEYRHKHILYCNMFNNTPYEKIEQPRDDNRPNSYLLEKYRKEWEAELDEVVHNCA